ncbi:unnamed protein product [Callosobruchus maculatus]|uniref:Lipocalin/cytosolic fatty-acid binding domain-containing protein n=1 Tax=Callosobruchus maculatus TaxID=64391 RepID=A0A653DM33_CALMS|nr:unnamed protein product [Callosobruchus maculatus]
MMLILLTLLGSLLFVDASNSTKDQHCQPLAPATNMVALFMTIGNRYLYAQHRFGAPLVSEKCWSDSAFFVEYNIFDNAMHHNWTLYDRKEGERIKRVKCSIIANSSKLYTIFEGREMVQTMIVVNPEYIVNYVCSGNEHAVIILTARKNRDERIIQEAIRAAKKIVDLPSPSVNMECDKYVNEM